MATLLGVIFLAVLPLTTGQQTPATVDPVIVSIAEAVAGRGEDAEFLVSRLRHLNIPYRGERTAIPGKKISRMVETRDGARPHTVWVVTTDKRYVIYHRVTAVELAACVDETGAIVGGGMWHIDGKPGSLTPTILETFAKLDRTYWAEELIPRRVAATSSRR